MLENRVFVSSLENRSTVHHPARLSNYAGHPKGAHRHHCRYLLVVGQDGRQSDIASDVRTENNRIIAMLGRA